MAHTHKKHLLQRDVENIVFMMWWSLVAALCVRSQEENDQEMIVVMISVFCCKIYLAHRLLFHIDLKEERKKTSTKTIEH